MEDEKNDKGISLLNRGKKSIINMVFSRLGLVVLLLLVQVGILFSIFYWCEDSLPTVYGGTILLTAIMVLYLLNSSIDPTAKITWLFIIMLLPVFGAVLFLFVQEDVGHRALKKRAQHITDSTKNFLPTDKEVWKALQKENPGAASLSRYLSKTGCYPPYQNSTVTYFPLGEDKFKELLCQLKQAKKFIFLEYFIVAEGTMWGRVLEILAQKAAEGVEVRMMYDGTCEFSTLPHNYPKRLEKLGIHCKMFAEITPFVSTHYNYRDHRKILVIDGHTAFNGGINLADEYINQLNRFGHWKDTAVMVKGDAVRSYTLMFLQMWSMDERGTDYEADFRPYLDAPTCPRTYAKGFVIPYGDCPVDSYKAGEQVYIDILNRAQHYVHIMSPYLILDGEMQNAIEFAAERGVDVRLILPGIPDKKMPYGLAWTHYPALLKAGVKIYEYTPGFVHAKVFVSDDREAVVGTINLDYRSLYHHFECATYMYGTDCIDNIEDDFIATQKKCRTVTMESVKKEKTMRKVRGILLKVIAPLM